VTICVAAPDGKKNGPFLAGVGLAACPLVPASIAIVNPQAIDRSRRHQGWPHPIIDRIFVMLRLRSRASP